MYGLLQDVIVLECAAFAVVVPQRAAFINLCDDAITNADIDSHIVTCSIPR